MDWDGEPTFQFARASRHREVVEQLLTQGKAYRCYASATGIAAMREQTGEGLSVRYDGRWRDRDEADTPAGITPVIRIKAPHTGETVINDRVQGYGVFSNEHLDDLVILRSDGTPTYMLVGRG